MLSAKSYRLGRGEGMEKVICLISVALLLAGCFTIPSNVTIDELLAQGYTKANFPEGDLSTSLPTTEERLHNLKVGLESRLIHVGTKESYLLEMCGYPQDVNTSVGSWGEHKQYVYGDSSHGRIYVYIENGVVTSWQL